VPRFQTDTPTVVVPLLWLRHVLVVPRFQTDTPTVVVPLLWLRHVLVMPRFQTDTYGRHAFTVARPMTWNLFCDYLRNLDLSIDSLPTHPQDVCVLTMCHALSALEALCSYALYKSAFTFTIPNPNPAHVLKSLHWLPVRQRIQYKVAMLTHKCLNSHAPRYVIHLACDPTIWQPGFDLPQLC